MLWESLLEKNTIYNDWVNKKKLNQTEVWHPIHIIIWIVSYRFVFLLFLYFDW